MGGPPTQEAVQSQVGGPCLPVATSEAVPPVPPLSGEAARTKVAVRPAGDNPLRYT